MTVAFDIHGNRLRPGYCEVHPHVEEPFPCGVCRLEEERRQGQREQYERAAREERDRAMVAGLYASVEAEIMGRRTWSGRDGR